jgi:hypothetical protein
MLSRALSLATVMLLAGCLTVRAENLDSGKTPAQLFAGTCNACHKSPRGLLKNVSASSLPGFLRQHYTTSSSMAGTLASYLISNGATDTRYQAKDQPKTDAAKGAKQEAARRPDADGITPQGEGGRPERDGKRRPGQAPDAARPAADGQTPGQAATDSKAGAKQKLGKRGKPAEEPPKTDEAAKDKDEASKHETAKMDTGKVEGEKPDAAKSDAARLDAAMPAGEDKPDAGKPDAGKSDTGKSETTAKVDAPRETVGGEPTPLRPDPVPPVTPAPPAAPASASGTSEPAASPSAPAATPAPLAPPAVTAAAPPPPVAPAGPPAPPISQ